MKFCTNCGAEIAPGIKFCPSCGNPVKTVEAENTAVPPPKSEPVPPPKPEPAPAYKSPGTAPVYSNQSEGEPFNISNLISRAINIVFKPKKEWEAVSLEKPDISAIILQYAVILALIPAIFMILKSGIIGYGYMGYRYKSWSMGLRPAIIQYITGVGGLFLVALIINLLATSFDSVKNYGRSLQLITYAYTPFWLAGIFFFIPGLSFIAYLSSIYTIFLLAWGLPYTMRTPKEKTIAYTIVIILATIVVYVIVMLVITAIIGLFFVSRTGFRLGSF